MTQYISKAALVAEIEKRLNYRIESLKAINNGTFWKEEQSEDEFNKPLTRCTFNAVKNELFELKCFLDTLEVKEVDLEKELDKFYGMYRKDGQTFSLEDNEECVDWKVDCNPKFEKAFAKHFFELGLKAQKEE